MTSVEEYEKMAEEAKEDGAGAHVAVLTYYRDTIEIIGYNQNAAPVLLAAVQYAQRLKKERDRKAIMQWSQRVVEKITPKTDLITTINQEIEKLQKGEKNATPTT